MACLLTIAVLGGCKGDAAPAEIVLAVAEVGPAGGTLLATPLEPVDGLVGARLVIPAGALDESVSLTMIQAPGPAFASGDRPPVAVHIEPSGTRFAVPAELTLEVTVERMEQIGWLGPEFVQAMTYDEAHEAWVPLRMTDASVHDTLSVTAELDSLSFKALITPIVFPSQRYTDPDLLAKRPVVLVHGLQTELSSTAATEIRAGVGGSTGTWGNLSPEGANLLGHETNPVPVYELRYYSHNIIESNACALKAAIKRILARQPGQQSVDIVAHSLGGLVARAYTEGLGYHVEVTSRDKDDKETCPYSADARVNRLLTLATPHGGSGIAGFDVLGAGKWGALDVGDQLQYDSEFLEKLNALPLTDLEAPAPEYKAVLAGSDLVVEGDRGSLLTYLDVPADGHADNEVTLADYGHTGKDGIANITSKKHAAYPIIVDFLGLNAATCAPSCAGRQCGDDGCGAACGSCTGGSVCVAGQCGSSVGCAPNCGDMLLVPAGTFTMGSPEDEPGRDPGEDQHAVTLTRSFYLQETEVTQGEWKAAMGNNPSSFGSCGDDCPVETVNWWEALAYANARSASEGLPACFTLEGCDAVSPGNGMECDAVTVNAPGGNPYACEGYRLPTEAEWEYAYRAGTTTAFYNGGITDTACHDPNVDAIGWYCGNSGNTTHRVGQKTPNAWGLYDMAGNVWEWCWERHDPYPGGPAADPTGAGVGSDKVLRGGSWLIDAEYARAASRGSMFAVFPYDDTGFRLAKSLP